MKYLLFIDYKYEGEVEVDESMLSVLNRFQITKATAENRVYTALDPGKGYAFSQTYQVVDATASPRKIRHGTMFKHEDGMINPPPIPSYHDLMLTAPQLW